MGGRKKTATIQTRFPLSEVMLARSRLAGKNVQLPRLRPLHDTLLLHRRPAAGLPLDQANASPEHGGFFLYRGSPNNHGPRVFPLSFSLSKPKTGFPYTTVTHTRILWRCLRNVVELIEIFLLIAPRPASSEGQHCLFLNLVVGAMNSTKAHVRRRTVGGD